MVFFRVFRHGLGVFLSYFATFGELPSPVIKESFLIRLVFGVEVEMLLLGVELNFDKSLLRDMLSYYFNRFSKDLRL